MSGQTCCQAIAKRHAAGCSRRKREHIAIGAAPGKTDPKRTGIADHHRAVGESRNVVSPTVRPSTSVRGQGSRKATCRARGYGIVEKAKARL